MSFYRTIEFWKVEDGYQGLESKLNNFFRQRTSSPGDATKVLFNSTRTEAVYLQNYTQNVNYVDGLVVKQWVEDTKKSKWKYNSLEDFVLEADSGFGETTYFMYLPRIKVLALLPGKHAARIGWFKKYIKQTVDVANFEVSVLLTKDAMYKLRNLHTISKILFTVRVGNGYPASSPLVQARSVRDMMKRNGKYLTIKQEISSPRKRGGGLTINVAKNFLNQLIVHKDDDNKVTLTDLKVKGAEDPEREESYIDVLAESYTLNIELQNGNAISYNECHEEVAPYIMQSQETLNELIGDVE